MYICTVHIVERKEKERKKKRGVFLYIYRTVHTQYRQTVIHMSVLTISSIPSVFVFDFDFDFDFE